MIDYAAYAEQQLRDAGYRLTQPRRQLLEVLAGASRALSPYAIVDLLAEEQRTPDVVTVYRNLELLEQLGLVHRVHSLNGYVACGHISGDGCHHPVICLQCGRIEEICGDGLPGFHQELNQRGWSVRGHVVEFTGICQACRAANAAATLPESADAAGTA